MLLLENPRKRRRKARRKATRRRSRRKNPTTFAAAAPRRRRRSTRRRATSRRRRRNPFVPGGSGGMVSKGLSIVGAEVAGDVLTRVLYRFGLSKIVPAAFGKSRALAVLRIGVGLLAGPVLKRLPLPANIKSMVGPVNVASGVLGLVADIRARMLAQAGLSDWVTSGELSDDSAYGVLGDDDASDYGILGDYVTAGELSDNGYEGSSGLYN